MKCFEKDCIGAGGTTIKNPIQLNRVFWFQYVLTLQFLKMIVLNFFDLDIIELLHYNIDY